jgi:hypothetical protein
VTPFHPRIGQNVTVAWTELNDSAADLGAYVTDVYVSGPDGEIVGSARLPGDGVKADSIAERSWTFEGGPKADGAHTVMIYMNAEGVDAGSGVPGEQGFRGATSVHFDVGGGEQAADSQNSEAWNAAISAFRSSTATLTEDDYVAQLADGVNWLAALDTLDAASQSELGRLGRTLSARQRGSREQESLLFANPDDLTDDASREQLARRQAAFEEARTALLGVIARPLRPDEPEDVARMLAAVQALANA